MSVSEHLRRTVALITAPGPSPGEPTRPVGSGFFVSVLESHLEPPYLTRRHEYLVTAGHLVRGEERTFVRMRRPESGRREGAAGVEEVGIGRWYWPEDDTRDVAAAPLGFSVGDFDHTTIHVDPFRTDPDAADRPRDRSTTTAAGLGDPIHIIALLAGASWAGPRGVAVVRSGTVAATWERVVILRGGARHTVAGHLIDGAGGGGGGGSPCFLSVESPREELPYLIQEARKLGDETLWQKALERHQETKLFGMTVGVLSLADSRGRASEVAGTAGMGIVAPREHVVDLIHSEPFREQRAEHMRAAVDAELARPGRGGDPATGTDAPRRSTTHSRRWR